ncbi:MAG: poly-gamma-glutamate synthase PgsB [Candidatus Marinimicrobia bacterium]|nr:poly-gamma-glutamate synthase PgsB [Candidatus Neomarinimicrobiota bacterium]
MLDIISSTLLILIVILISFGVLEVYIHNRSVLNLPIRIHVNGTRGKSSVTRLIAAGLRESGLKVLAKTTGTTPRVINEFGKDKVIHRLRSASIGEQVKLMRSFSYKKPDAIVMECMAVNPQYQWVSEHKIVQSTLSVITNVRADHLDEMGTTNSEIAYSLSNTIPYNSACITSEKDQYPVLEKISKIRQTKISQSDINDIDKKYLQEFPFLEHPENLSLALRVCENLGVDRKVALNGMKKTTPDPGALFIFKLSYKNNCNNFISGFAANDPESTKMVWDLIDQRFDGKKCVFLNTRDDRRYRTLQLLDLVLKDIRPDMFIIRADNISNLLPKYDVNDIELKQFSMSATVDDVVDEIINLDSFNVLGIGNIVGWGEEFLQKIKVYRT